MNEKRLLALWGVMFILCAGLGFIPEAEGFFRWLSIALSVLFFLPPVLLLKHCPGRRTASLIRNLSLASLGLTLFLLVLNIASVLWPLWLGDILNVMLVIVSAPMVCGRNWLLSLFFWACLLVICLKQLKKSSR